ncbi:MAG: radical SAM protein [Pseudomonadota bacterium]
MDAAIVYDEPLFRPPSEWRSLILQLTLGCSHNRCSFCGMYRMKRFRIRPLAEVQAEIDAIARVAADQVDRVFLADGDALVIKPRTLLTVLAHLRTHFPRLRRINAYATPQNLLVKTEEQLAALHEAGLNMLYVGLESGDGDILAAIDKGVDPAQFVEACARAHRAGFKLSLTVLNNLVAPARSAGHVRGTVEVVNAVHPAYLACLTLIPGPMALHHAAATGWRSMRDREVCEEIAALLRGLDVDGTEFRANHASNALPLQGRLNRDRERLLGQLDRAIEDPASDGLRPLWMRRL